MDYHIVVDCQSTQSVPLH